MDDPSFIGFYAAIPRSALADVETVVRMYVTRYLITCECSPDSHKATKGWHMHLLIQGTDKDYRNMILNLKKLYKLQGKTTKDNAHGYGRVRGELRSVERCITYMLKQQPPILEPYVHESPVADPSYAEFMRYDTFDYQFLRDCQLKSFPKENPNKIRDEIMHWIGDLPPHVEYDPDVEYQLVTTTGKHPVAQAKELIIDYYRQQMDKAPTRSKMQYYLMHYFVQYNPYVLSNSQICEWFY